MATGISTHEVGVLFLDPSQKLLLAFVVYESVEETSIIDFMS